MCGKTEGGQFLEVPRGSLQIRDRKRVTDEGKDEETEIVAFGYRK